MFLSFGREGIKKLVFTGIMATTDIPNQIPIAVHIPETYSIKFIEATDTTDFAVEDGTDAVMAILVFTPYRYSNSAILEVILVTQRVLEQSFLHCSSDFIQRVAVVRFDKSFHDNTFNAPWLPFEASQKGNLPRILTVAAIMQFGKQ